VKSIMGRVSKRKVLSIEYRGEETKSLFILTRHLSLDTLYLPVANRPWVNRPPRLQMAVKLTFLREWEEVTLGELQQGSGTSVLLVLKVRPEAFRSSR
jgi:hypothetical protein